MLDKEKFIMLVVKTERENPESGEKWLKKAEERSKTTAVKEKEHWKRGEWLQEGNSGSVG